MRRVETSCLIRSSSSLDFNSKVREVGFVDFDIDTGADAGAVADAIAIASAVALEDGCKTTLSRNLAWVIGLT